MGTQIKCKNNILRIIFNISLLVVPLTVLFCVFMGTIVGIDHGWAMPAWSDGSKMYGIDAILSYLLIFGVVFRWFYVAVVGYQIVYMIHKLKIKQR